MPCYTARALLHFSSVKPLGPPTWLDHHLKSNCQNSDLQAQGHLRCPTLPTCADIASSTVIDHDVSPSHNALNPAFLDVFLPLTSSILVHLITKRNGSTCLMSTTSLPSRMPSQTLPLCSSPSIILAHARKKSLNLASDPKPKNGPNPAPAAQNAQAPAHSSLSARDHLPGGQMYHDHINNVYRDGNPRQRMPVPQWLREWEEKWQRIPNQAGNDGE